MRGTKINRRPWAIILAAAAALLVLAAYLGDALFYQPVVPGDTTAIITGNLEFVFPLLLASAILTVLSLSFWIYNLIRGRPNTLIQIALPPLLLITWLVPPLLNSIARRHFISTTQHSIHPIDTVVSRLGDLDELEGGSGLILPPDTGIRDVIDHVLRNQGFSTYAIVEEGEIQTFDPESQKPQRFNAFAVDCKDTGRRVFLLRYDKEQKSWAIQAYYVPDDQKPQD